MAWSFYARGREVRLGYVWSHRASLEGTIVDLYIFKLVDDYGDFGCSGRFMDNIHYVCVVGLLIYDSLDDSLIPKLNMKSIFEGFKVFLEYSFCLFGLHNGFTFVYNHLL